MVLYCKMAAKDVEPTTLELPVNRATTKEGS